MDEYQSERKGSPLLRGGIVAAIVVLTGAAVAYSRKPSGTDMALATTPSPSASTSVNSVTALPASNDTTTVGSSTYKDGTYNATGSYEAPSGSEDLNVQLTVTHDVVTAATVTPGLDGGESRQYQQRFIAGYKQYVIGRNIEGLSLSHVSGSSLTSGGFNAAVAKIKSLAKA